MPLNPCRRAARLQRSAARALQADETRPWGLAASDSIFLKGLAKTFKELDATEDYEQLLKALPMLRSYAISMRAALKMRPSKDDYALVDKHMRLYALHKALLRWHPDKWAAVLAKVSKPEERQAMAELLQETTQLILCEKQREG